MNISLFGESITFHDNLKTEIAIYNHFVKFANQFSAEYEDFYYSCSGVTEIISQSKSFVDEKFAVICDKIISILAANNIFGISVSQLYNYHQGFHINSALSNLQSNVNKLKEQRDQEIAYRSHRKATRGKFIGGGFGVSGAVKGMAMAGAANMATGAMHSVANAFGNMGTASRYSSKLRNFQSSSGCSALSKAIYTDCIEFYDVLEECLGDHGFRKGQIRDKIKKADTIYSQIISNQIPKSNINNALASMISTFPGKEEYYSLARRISKEPVQHLIECMNYFEVDSTEFKMVDASCVWREFVFGQYSETIENKKNKFDHYNPYLQDFFYAEHNKGIIPYLDASLSLATCIEENTDCLKEWESISSDKILPLTNGRNGNLLNEIICLFGVNLSPNELPLVLMKIISPLLSETIEQSWILITTNHIFRCHNKSTTSLDICEINKVSVHKNGINFNGKLFAETELYLNEFKAVGLEDYLWALIILLQCLHTTGMQDRKIALIDNSDEYRYHENIKQYFSNDIASVLTTDNELQSFVSEYCSPTHLITVSKISKITSKDLKAEINTLEKGEILLYCTEGFGGYLLLTNKRLRISYKKLPKQSIELNDINTIYYSKEKRKIFINQSIGVDTISNEKEGKEFCDCFKYIQEIALRYTYGATRTSELSDQSFVKETENKAKENTIKKAQEECVCPEKEAKEKARVEAEKRQKAEAAKKAEEERVCQEKEVEQLRVKKEAEENARTEAEKKQKAEAAKEAEEERICKEKETKLRIKAEAEAKVKLENKLEEKKRKKEARKSNPTHLAFASLVLAIISYPLITTIIMPIITVPISVILGIKGMKSTRKGISLLGIILSFGIVAFYIWAIAFA